LLHEQVTVNSFWVASRASCILNNRTDHGVTNKESRWRRNKSAEIEFAISAEIVFITQADSFFSCNGVDCSFASICETMLFLAWVWIIRHCFQKSYIKSCVRTFKYRSFVIALMPAPSRYYCSVPHV